MSPLASWIDFFPPFFTPSYFSVHSYAHQRESSLFSRFLIARISAHILSNFHILAFALICFRVTEQTDY